MRNTFARELVSLAAEDERIVLLSGDIGNKLFDGFKEIAPDRFYNCGVAEADMIGVASGLAMMGFRPVTYTITPFTTYRCLEQIRIDLCYHHLPVVIVGTGSGLAYAELGPTHQSCEDIGVLRALPNLSIVCPADPVEVRLGLRAALSNPGPVYLRLGKKGEPVLHGREPDFRIGRSITLRPGSDGCILATGNCVELGLQVAERLNHDGISFRVESFHTVKPLDERLLGELSAEYRWVVTLEEHSLIGGLGSAIAEWAADHRSIFHLMRFGTGDRFLETVGTQAYARGVFGLDAENIATRIRAVVRNEG